MVEPWVPPMDESLRNDDLGDEEEEEEEGVHDDRPAMDTAEGEGPWGSWKSWTEESSRRKGTARCRSSPFIEGRQRNKNCKERCVGGVTVGRPPRTPHTTGDRIQNAT